MSVKTAAMALILGLALLTGCRADLSKFEKAQRQTVLIQASEGQGSAVTFRLYNDEGKPRWFAWTAAHVVENETLSTNDATVTVKVVLRTEGRKVGVTTYTGYVIRVNSTNDLALLFIDAPADAFISAKLAPKGVSVCVGDEVYACGNFAGHRFDGTVSRGSISQLGVRPAIDDWPWAIALDQADITVMGGASGGPLFRNGEVIGIVVGKTGDSITFFVPVSRIYQWLQEDLLLRMIGHGFCPADYMLREYGAFQ